MDDKLELLRLWQEAVVAAVASKKVIETEQELRKQVMAAFFPEPNEGVNSAELTGGWVLKGTHKLDRKLDEAVLPAIFKRLQELNISTDSLVKYKPELVIKAYKSLLEINEEAGKVFDEALTIKPASPTLELIAPKAAS